MENINKINEVKFEVLSKIENIVFARTAATSFLVNINPTISFINEFKTVVSEAVTNAIVHGYENRTNQYVFITLSYDNSYVYLTIKDNGIGIKNIDEAREPLFTTKLAEERAGLGFTIMEVFTDSMEVESVVGKGTTLVFKKKYREDGIND